MIRQQKKESAVAPKLDDSHFYLNRLVRQTLGSELFQQTIKKSRNLFYDVRALSLRTEQEFETKINRT